MLPAQPWPPLNGRLEEFLLRNSDSGAPDGFQPARDIANMVIAKLDTPATFWLLTLPQTRSVWNRQDCDRLSVCVDVDRLAAPAQMHIVVPQPSVGISLIDGALAEGLSRNNDGCIEAAGFGL